MTPRPEIVFLLEELSAQAMLEGLVPRLVPDGIAVRYIPFEGKSDLERQLARRVQRYANPAARFIVLRDQDAADCQAVKARLAGLCKRAGRPSAVVRIACRELEAFYLADLAAVEHGMGLTGLARRQNRAKYRSPDAMTSPSAELKRLTDGAYQKVSCSRAIGPQLDPGNSRSRSFMHLVAAIRRLATELSPPP